MQPRAVVAVVLLLVATPFVRAQTPPSLWFPVAQPPAAAVSWDAGERVKNPMIVQSAFVHVDAAALQALPPGGAGPMATFTLDLPSGPVPLELTSDNWTLGYRTLRGHVPGKTSAVVLTIAGSGEVNGLLDVGDAQFALASTPAAGVQVLQSIDASQLPPSMASCGLDHTHAISSPLSGPQALVVGNSDCSLATIDIVVFYTPAARNGAGGTAAIETTIVNAIEQANVGHGASAAPVEFRLVHLAETNYAEVGSNTDLSRFRSQSDGFMDEVHQVRDDYGGDLMHLIIEPPASFCGVGYLMTNLSAGFASSAFAVTVRTCIPNRTLSHECGHNIGCHHDFANAGSTPIYPYSYGYRTPDNAYRTIMSYAPGARVNRWSGPNVTYQGYTMGVAGSADNVLSIANTGATVAQFRATRAPRWCQLGGGVGGAAGLPTLVGSGTIGQPGSLELRVANYGATGLGVLILGLQPVNVPLFGGTLVPSIDYTDTLIGTGAEIVHDAGWLEPLAPGLQVWCQAAFLDATAPQGLSASDAVRVTRP
ncbi:MAG: hypothetical protein KDC48_19765 [Planctomycetes bacterium]|nr:hypothetical protein [Planctomycetota bacterium]